MGDNFEGFILNIPKVKWYVFHGRHWLTIKRVDETWYNLDAKLKQPRAFKSDLAVQTFLRRELTSNEAELIIVRNDDDQINIS